MVSYSLKMIFLSYSVLGIALFWSVEFCFLATLTLYITVVLRQLVDYVNCWSYTCEWQCVAKRVGYSAGVHNNQYGKFVEGSRIILKFWKISKGFSGKAGPENLEMTENVEGLLEKIKKALLK